MYCPHEHVSVSASTDGRDGRSTHTRRSAFSFASASFFACFAWFSFLQKGLISHENVVPSAAYEQSNVIWVQQAFDGCELAGLLSFSLQPGSERTVWSIRHEETYHVVYELTR